MAPEALQIDLVQSTLPACPFHVMPGEVLCHKFEGMCPLLQVFLLLLWLSGES